MDESDYQRRFLHELTLLRASGLDSAEIERAVEDVREKFEFGLTQGKSNQIVAETLGDPAERALGLLALRLMRSKTNSFRSRLRILGRVFRMLASVAPVNFLLTLAPVVIFGLIAVFVVGASLRLLFASLASLSEFVSASGSLPLGTRAAVILFLLGFVFAWLALSSSMALVVRAFSRLAWSWTRWNVSFLMKDAGE